MHFTTNSFYQLGYRPSLPIPVYALINSLVYCAGRIAFPITHATKQKTLVFRSRVLLVNCILCYSIECLLAGPGVFLVPDDSLNLSQYSSMRNCMSPAWVCFGNNVDSTVSSSSLKSFTVLLLYLFIFLLSTVDKIFNNHLYLCCPLSVHLLCQ